MPSLSQKRRLGAGPHVTPGTGLQLPSRVWDWGGVGGRRQEAGGRGKGKGERGKAGRTGDKTVRLRVSPGGYEFGDPTGCLCLLTSLTPRGRPGAELGPRSALWLRPNPPQGLALRSGCFRE